MEKDLSLTRTVVVFDSTNNTKYEFKTDSNKWADIVELCKAGGVNLSNKTAVCKSNSCTLQLPNADIPEGDQIIFLTPSKQNSGGLEKDIDEMSYVELRRAAKGLNGYEKLGGNPTKDELKKVIKSSYKDSKPKAKKEAVVELKKKAKDTAPDLVTKVAELEQMVLSNTVNLANFITAMKTAVLATEANMGSVVTFEKLPEAKPKAVKQVLSNIDVNISEAELAKQCKALLGK